MIIVLVNLELYGLTPQWSASLCIMLFIFCTTCTAADEHSCLSTVFTASPFLPCDLQSDHYTKHEQEFTLSHS